MAIALTTSYVYPPAGDSDGADLVYVLGPPTSPRLTAAQAVLQRNPSALLLVSVSPAGSRRALDASSLPICSSSIATCETPSPFTTKGEALLLNDYARTHEVHRVVILTVTPHVARARYIFARCAPSLDVQVVAVDEGLPPTAWVDQIVYQTGAFAKAIATPCASDDE
jgi:uncharacterized SAM-binding protein YcdF (DUF218 family)